LKDQIGGDRIEVTIREAGRVQDAVVAIRSVSTGEPQVADARISAPVTGGSTVLVDAIRALDAQGIEVDDLTLRRPTLDDVFLSLTGHAAEDQEAPVPKTRRRAR
jgi:ABC-2 type transport system ATP-binding protein